MDDPWAAATREAYASAPSAVTIFHTLEFWHPSFDVPARVVRDHGVLITEDPVVFGRMLTLEGDAPRNAGESVLFVATQFTAAGPGSEENVAPEITLSIDGVPGDLSVALRNSTTEPGEIEVIYREYFADDPSGPHFIQSGLTLKRTSVTMLRVSGKAQFSDPTAKSFPGTTYDSDEYPSLSQ